MADSSLPAATAPRKDGLTITPLAVYLTVIASELALLAVMSTDTEGLLGSLVFLFCFGILARAYFLLPDLTSRLLVTFFTLSCSVHIGFFIRNAALFDTMGISKFFMESDRFAPYWNIGALFCFLTAGRLLLESIALRRAFPILVFLLCMTYFVIKTYLNLPHFSRVSYYQISMDWVLITSCAVMASCLRPSDIDIAVIRRWMPSLVAVFILLQLVDSLGAIFHAVPWAISVRNGFQGLFSGTENQFGFQSAVAGLVVLITAKRANLWTHVALFLFFCVMALMSKALTAFLMLLLIAVYLLLSPPLSRRVLNLGWGSMWGGTALLLLFFGTRLGIFDINSTLVARIGTVIAPYQLWLDDPWFGIGTGIFDTTHITNLAAYLFDSGAASFLAALNLGTTVASEVAYRSDQFQGGEINPHLTPLALVYFYGLAALPFALFFTFFLPGHLMAAMKRIPDPFLRLIPVMTLYYLMVAMLDPILPLFEIVFTMVVVAALSLAIRPTRQN